MKAAEFENTVGYPAFFRNQAEWDLYERQVPKRKEWIGIEQGDSNSEWFNADGSEVTFTLWQWGEPSNSAHLCAITGHQFDKFWNDQSCTKSDVYYSCRSHRET